MARSECKAVPGCQWATEAPIKDVVGCAAAWHVYEEHPEVWRSVFGDRPPQDPDPRTNEGMLRIAQANLEEAVEWALSALAEEADHG
jgi:hypothetical protein